MEEKYQELTIEDGQKALRHHIVEKALALRAKYGSFIDMDVLKTILNDEEFVKYPTKIEFDSDQIDKGLFAVSKRISTEKGDHYVIYVHEHFKNRLGDVPPLVLYHLVTVNYGDFATFFEAELFGSTVLDMEQEYYYRLLCRLADQIPIEEKKQDQ